MELKNFYAERRPIRIEWVAGSSTLHEPFACFTDRTVVKNSKFHRVAMNDFLLLDNHKSYENNSKSVYF